MRRVVVLSLLLSLGVLSLWGRQGRGGAAAAPPLEIQKVKDRLYMITGGCQCGNTAVFLTDAGVVVVDTKNPNTGKGILEQIKTITDKPVTMIINTHSHQDHTGSNEDFPANIDIVAHENTKANMMRMPNFQGDKAKFIAKTTYKDKLTLGKGPDEIDLFYFGPAHTSGDSFVVFPALRAMHAGDAFARKSTPIIDANNGGSAAEFGKTLSKAAAAIRNVDTIISGHGPLMTMEDLREYADFNKGFIAWVQGEINAGKTPEQAAMEYKIPDKYNGYTVNAIGGIQGNIQLAYKELSAKK
jgi:glyoxylase-like metal-dependent hydrolase (beta-lactamase superfamily II)